MISHLIEVHGCQRIAFLAGPPGNEDSYWRALGYQEALATHAIPYDPALVAMGGFDEEEAAAPVERWLQDGIDFDAIFTGGTDIGQLDSGTGSGGCSVAANSIGGAAILRMRRTNPH